MRRPPWTEGARPLLREHPSEHLYHLEAMNRREARKIWREGIHQAWGHRCAFCDGQPVEDRPLTIDHVHPRTRGGNDLTSNCVSCCERCNRSKGSEQWTSWFRRQPFYSDWREIDIRFWLDQGRRAGQEDRAA